ncbi:MAG: ATP-binding protein [Zoogloea sp.]|nr:ATP-binding protein [Zoogloea sp.]
MNRTFKPLRTPSSKDDAFGLAWGERFDEAGVSWDELLKSQRILIVSEAGAGKTYECESKARELFARGEPAFFLSLESVASAGVVATLFGDEHKRFTDWLASSSQAAYFFLDSIDELQLVHRSFKDALRRFAYDAQGALGRATVVITARPVPIDRQAFRDILPVPAPVRQEDSQDEFIRIAMDGPTKTKDNGPPAIREVELLPLTDPQIMEFAASRGVESPEALLSAIDAKHAREFARKPQDLIELCDDWREHGALRAHFEQIKSHVRARLAARPERREKAELSLAKALNGAQRLALAVILSRRLTIRYSAGSDGDSSGAAPIDPRELLADWGPNEVLTLLERPIFVEGGYGRVRFHHRSVMEFLAARQIHDLIEAGLLVQSAACRMLFGRTGSNETILRPSMRPVAAWLALLRTDMFERVVKIEPDCLLTQGDPESLTDLQRERALLGFVARYGKGQWRGLEVPNLQVARLAQLGLAGTVQSAWAAGVEAPEVRELLLRLVSAGRMQGCADLVAHVAADASCRDRERFEALLALAALGDSRLAPMVDAIVTLAPGWSERLARWVGTMLYPEHVTEAQLVHLLARVRSEKRDRGGYADSVARVIQKADLSQVRLEALLPDVLRLAREGLSAVEEEFQEADGRLEMSSILRSLCLRLLELGSVSDTLIEASVLARRSADGSSGLGKGKTELSTLLDSLPNDWRPRVFEADLACLESLGGDRSARYRLVRIVYEGALNYTLERDGPWVQAALADVQMSPDRRAVLLHLAAHLYAIEGGLKDGEGALRRAVADSTALTDELNSIVASSEPSAEFLKMQEEQRKRQERQAKKRADERDAWARIRRELAEQPALALGLGRRGSTIWNLWLVLRKLGRNGDEGRWDRAFLTSQFGGDITERLRLALMAYWRGMRPTVRCERRRGEENTYLTVWRIGLMAIYAEAEDPLWAAKLKPSEAELVARYALLELNGLPSWLGSLAKAHPTEVETVVGTELLDELLDGGGDSGWHSMVLQSLRNGTQDVAQLLLPRLVGWLAWSGSALMQLPHSRSNEQKLSQVVRVLLAHAGPEVKGPLEELAAAQVQAVGTGPYLLFWLPVLFSLAPSRGVESMLPVLAALPVEPNGTAVHIIGSLFNERTGFGSTEWASKLAPAQLLRLTLEFHRHVRSEDDLVHDTVYSPGARDAAEDGRRYIFDALMKASGPEALSAKLALAADPLFERLRDRIAALAQERLAAEIDSSAWNPTEVATLLARKELSPKTTSDMAQLLVDRLDDLQELLLKDTGPRAGWASIDDENTLRPLIARELEVASREAYTVDQEAVTADGKETDIRLRAVSGYQATIELKVGEKGRSARELCDTIDDQLVKKYMAHRDARTGCLLVSVADPGRYWLHPGTGERIDRFGLQALLQAKADAAQLQLGGDARVIARVLDLVPRLSTEKKAASTAR